MNYIKIKKSNKKIIKQASKIKLNELRWAWIKFIYAKRNKRNITLNSPLKSSLFEILTIKCFNILKLCNFFIIKQKRIKTLMYCNQKSKKNIFNQFFKRIKQNQCSALPAWPCVNTGSCSTSQISSAVCSSRVSVKDCIFCQIGM